MDPTKRTRRLGAAALALGALLLGGCDSVQGLTADQAVPAAVSWGEIQPILQKSCLPCHNDAVQPAFKDEATTGPQAASIRSTIVEGWMPVPGTVKFSFHDRDMLLRWADSAMTRYAQKKED